MNKGKILGYAFTAATFLLWVGIFTGTFTFNWGILPAIIIAGLFAFYEHGLNVSTGKDLVQNLSKFFKKGE